MSNFKENKHPVEATNDYIDLASEVQNEPLKAPITYLGKTNPNYLKEAVRRTTVQQQFAKNKVY